MSIDYGRYPADWRTVIRPRILERANGRCEWCGIENGAVGWRGAGGEFHVWPPVEPQWIAAERIIKIVLTIAHIDHDIEHNDDGNLAALCQRCHLRHDGEQHRRNAAETRRRRQREAGQGEFW